MTYIPLKKFNDMNGKKLNKLILTFFGLLVVIETVIYIYSQF